MKETGIRFKRACKALCAGALIAASPLCMAWPDKLVKIVVPAPAGGLMDMMARLLGDQLSTDSGQPVIVENKPGAGGAIGVKTMLAAPADGQTVMVIASNILTEIPLVFKVNFDPLKDVKAVGTVATSRLMLVGSSTLPAKDFKSLLAELKANPGKLSYGSYSVGTASHYAGVILNQKAGLDLQHVPFPGAPPAIAQVVGGQVTVMFDNVAHSLPMVQGGKLRVYGLASPVRSKLLPGVPTFAELGYPDLDFSNWMGVIVGSATPADVVEKIHAAIAKAGASAKLQKRLAEMGFEPMQTPSVEQLKTSVQAEYDRNAGIVRAFSIKGQE